MPCCETCGKHATWRDKDGFACSQHKDGLTATYLGKVRRFRLAEWAKNLPDEGTVKLKEGTYLHKALVAAFQGRNRFVDVRDNRQNAGSLQKALILGLIEQIGHKFQHGYRYHLTDIGREALYKLSQTPFYKYVEVAYKKNKAWADHAQNFCW